jgi:hypothetical protein
MTNLSFVRNHVSTTKFTNNIVIPKQYSMKSIFTSNVYYKLNTNTTVSGTVRNSRSISKKT